MALGRESGCRVSGVGKHFHRSLLPTFALLLPFAGCSPKSTVTGAESAKKKKSAKIVATVPGAIEGENWRIAWRSRNPKSPNKWAPPLLTGIAESGEVGGDEKNPTLSLQNFRAKLFTEGKLTANILAPQVDADQTGKEVLATGGVTVISPKTGTVTKADRVTWDIDSGKIIGEGNVSSFRKATAKSPDISQTGNKFTYDPDREEFEIE